MGDDTIEKVERGSHMLLDRTVRATLQQAAKIAQSAPGVAYSLVLEAFDDPAEIAKTNPRLAYDLMLDKLARQEIPMGVRDQQEYVWPELREFELVPHRKDYLNDYYEANYLLVGGDSDLSVVMNAEDFISSGKPGKFKAFYHDKTKTGTWRDIEDIPRVLRGLITESQKARKEAEEALTKLGGPKWRLTYDWGQLVAEYLNPDRMSDTTMTATFEGVDDVIFKGSPGEAVISYVAGYDYEGAYGHQEAVKAYRSKEDIERILKEAERLWDRWQKG